jgi:hypothetical protein
VTSPQYGSKWRRVRKQVLERDGYVCQVRLKRCTITATCVDHIVPVSAGGSWLDKANLRAACEPCNLGRVDRRRLVDADASDVVARLRVLGLNDAADAAQAEQDARGVQPVPSRDW